MASLSTFSFYYSGNGTPANSIGGAFSGIVVPNSKAALFPNVTLAQASAGVRQYRCVYLRAGNFQYSDLRLFLSGIGTPSSDSQVYVGLGLAAANAAETAVADELTPPEGVVFILPMSELFALRLPDMAPNTYKSLWLQRVVTGNAQGFADDYARIKITGEQR